MLTSCVRTGGPATRGYRLCRRRPYRNWLLHRAVVDMLVKEWNPFGWPGIPEGMPVHHQDFDRGNCAPGNLILMQACFHMHQAGLRDPYSGRFISRDTWEFRYGAAGELEEVPF